MNVYDFDKTIYDGESSLDFFLYCAKKYKRLYKYIPLIIIKGIMYKLNIAKENDLYSLGNNLGVELKDNEKEINDLIKEFWSIYSIKLDSSFLKQLSKEDLIISASPEFLLKGVQEYIKDTRIIGSEFDFNTGKLTFACYGKNKVKKFDEEYSNENIDIFYTDSLSDLPMIKKSDTAYIVTRKRKIKKYK